MEKKLNELLKKLDKSILNTGSIDGAYDIVEEIEQRDDAIDAIKPVLRLMEKYPNIDFGQPGPLVHFIEKYYKKGYEEMLVDSLRRCPTRYTVWMLNRVIKSKCTIGASG